VHVFAKNAEGQKVPNVSQRVTEGLCEKCAAPRKLNRRKFGVFQAFSLCRYFSDRPFCHRLSMLQAVINREFADLKEEAIGGDSEENRAGNWLVSECSLLFSDGRSLIEARG
jgi:hypothetical protein